MGDGRAVQWQDSAGRARRAAGSCAGVSLRPASGATSRFLPCPAERGRGRRLLIDQLTAVHATAADGRDDGARRGNEFLCDAGVCLLVSALLPPQCPTLRAPWACGQRGAWATCSWSTHLLMEHAGAPLESLVPVLSLTHLQSVVLQCSCSWPSPSERYGGARADRAAPAGAARCLLPRRGPPLRGILPRHVCSQLPRGAFTSLCRCTADLRRTPRQGRV